MNHRMVARILGQVLLIFASPRSGRGSDGAGMAYAAKTAEKANIAY